MNSVLKILKSLDWTIVLALLALMTIGVMFIYSSGVNSDGILVNTEYIKQIVWCSTGIIILVIASVIDIKRISDYLPFIYAFFILLLIYTAVLGKTVNGSKSWLGLIGGFGIQPSEFVKISTALFLARYLEKSAHLASSFKRFFISGLIVFLPMALILIQPDFGTALVFLPIYLVMAYMGGINKRYLLFLLIVISIASVMTVMPLWQSKIAEHQYVFLKIFYEKPYIYYMLVALLLILSLSIIGYRVFKKKYYYWLAYSFLAIFTGLFLAVCAHKFLKDYQIMRLVVFLDPQIDPLNSGWNIIQSITAIGSGGFTGKGFLQGTQSHARYIPQQSTDFIFSIISEELGFLGGLFIFALFFYIFIKLALSIRTMKSIESMSFIGGILAMLIFHFTINIGMTMGIMPITGIPLLFLSYGGSSLWASCIGLGICLGANARKYDI